MLCVYNLYGLFEDIMYLMWVLMLCWIGVKLVIGVLIVNICVYVFDSVGDLVLWGVFGELYLVGDGVV